MRQRLYEAMMDLGARAGCHQLPERSFFFKGRQFPVCARCTGVLLGQLAGMAAYFVHPLTGNQIAVLCLVMLADWALQAAGIRESTNVRRLLTGGLCGFGLGELYIMLLLRFV